MDTNLISVGSQRPASLDFDGKKEIPTRDEFYTNYPFFKYWKNDDLNRPEAFDELNIYIHIPYCIQICDYCFYNKELVKSKEQVDTYIDHLCREMQLISELYQLQKRPVRSIYIGGGTPSVLTQAQLNKMIGALRQYHAIDKPEFTFEAEPGTFSKTKLEWYKECGINRISMGVQSFDDNIIRLSSRKHTSAQAVKSIELIREIGGFNLNIDLLSGLAGEEMSSWQKSVEIALGQDIQMLTIYKMKAYANTNFFSKGVHKKEIHLPSETEEIEFMRWAIQRVKQSDFSPWSTFAFSKGGYVHDYIENIWRGQDLIAYGVSAFGKIKNTNYQNLNDTNKYFQKIEAGQMPLYRKYVLSVKDVIARELLLCGARLSSYRKKEFVKKYGFDYFKLIPGVITTLIENGYIEDNRDELVLTDHGILFADFVGKVLASSVKDVLEEDSIGFAY